MEEQLILCNAWMPLFIASHKDESYNHEKIVLYSIWKTVLQRKRKPGKIAEIKTWPYAASQEETVWAQQSTRWLKSEGSCISSAHYQGNIQRLSVSYIYMFAYTLLFICLNCEMIWQKNYLWVLIFPALRLISSIWFVSIIS